MSFEKAHNSRKRKKLMLWGPPGCWKTRIMLRLLNSEDSEPRGAIMDTEYGTDWYKDDFNFLLSQEINPDLIEKDIYKLLAKPGNVRALGLDTFTLYYEELVAKFADLFLKREITSPGHKREYYVIQPRDYQAINRPAYKFVRNLLNCDLNIIAICQIKDRWKDMKVDGTIYDGPRKLAHYFDTLIEITEKKNGEYTAFCKKDRSHSFKKHQELEWKSEDQIYEMLKHFDFIGGDVATAYVPPVEDAPATSEVDAKKWYFDKIKDLKKRLDMGKEDWARMLLDRYKVKTAVDLNEDQLKVFIKDLEAKLERKATREEPKELTLDSPEEKKEPEPQEEKTEEKKAELEREDTKDLIAKVAALKRELHITDRAEWNKLIAPFKVKTAVDLSAEQLTEFIKKLEDMRPTNTQAD